MSREHRFASYYDQLKTDLAKTYGTDFPPLDPSNRIHQETLEDTRLPIRQGQKNFLIAWRQVVDKTGWTLDEQKEIADVLSSVGHGIKANSQILTSFSNDPLTLLACSIWYWKRQAEVEKILDDEDRQVIKEKMKGIDGLSKSLVDPDARLMALEKLETELEDLEGKIEERRQSNARIDRLYANRRAKYEQKSMEPQMSEIKTRDQVSPPTISASPPETPTPNEPEYRVSMTTQQLMDSHNANLAPGDLKLNLTQFEKLMELVRFTETMSCSPDQSEGAKLAIQYIILHYQYYLSLLTTYPSHTVELDCPYHDVKITFHPTKINIENGTMSETFLPDNSLQSLRSYLECRFNNQANRQRAFDSIGRGWAGPQPEQIHEFG